MKKHANRGISKLRKRSFLRLVEVDQDLAMLREMYASKSPAERRMAADWNYHAAIAGEMFAPVMAQAGWKDSESTDWPAGIAALAIDPLYAPALLTVGSIEYQLGRTKAAMTLFMKLTRLPKDEEDLSEIIDKAGTFLADQGDYENALELYLAAERLDPEQTIYLIGSGYCLAKLGRLDEAVEKHRQAVAKAPENYEHLNDLGYVLLEAGELEEAEAVLKKGQMLAPSDYELPGNNLKELLRRKQQVRAG